MSVMTSSLRPFAPRCSFVVPFSFGDFVREHGSELRDGADETGIDQVLHDLIDVLVDLASLLVEKVLVVADNATAVAVAPEPLIGEAVLQQASALAALPLAAG